MELPSTVSCQVKGLFPSPPVLSAQSTFQKKSSSSQFLPVESLICEYSTTYISKVSLGSSLTKFSPGRREGIVMPRDTAGSATGSTTDQPAAWKQECEEN